MTRRELREHVFKLLFGLEFHEVSELPAQIAVYAEHEQIWDETDGAYIREKCMDVAAHIEEIDDAVNEVSGMDAIAPVTIEKADSGDNNEPSETPDTNKPQENDKESTPEGKPDIPNTGKPDNSQENTPLDASKADTSEKAQNKGSVDKAEKGVDTGDKTQAQIYALGMLGALVAGSILWILRKKKELQIK